MTAYRDPLSILFDHAPPPPGPWTRRSACRGLDPELFFPKRGKSSDEAKATCAACPVAAECLEYSLATKQAFGVWGGASERQRRRLRRERTETAA